MDIDTATRVWFENLRSMTDALDHLLAEKDALIASQARRIEELEARIADIATRIDRQVTRLKNRAAAGVCPCCNRTFTNLARHMAGQHPTFKAEAVDGDNIVPLRTTP